MLESATQQVFVQLGPVPAYAWHYIRLAREANPDARTVLFTDSRVSASGEGVEIEPVAAVASAHEFREIADALRSVDLDPTWRRGYWLRIFGRFLVLRNAARRMAQGPVVHLECDVLSSIDQSTLASLLATMTAPAAMPFIDDDTACPGIVVARDPAALETLAGRVVDSLLDGNPRSDMRVLADARSLGLVQALPTLPGDASVTGEFECALGRGWGPRELGARVFDGAAIGQYLFGIDPRNNHGVRIPGYRETRGGIDPGAFTDWAIARDSAGRRHVAFRHRGALGVVNVLHIHAKVTVGPPDPGNPGWLEALAVANGLQGAQASISLRPYLRYRLGQAVRRLTAR